MSHADASPAVCSTPTNHEAAIRFIAERESNAKTYARTFDRMLARGSMSTVWDVDGKQYIDLLACAGALPLGHNHPYVMARVNDFLGSGHVLQGLDIATPAKLGFLEQLMQTLPAAFAEDARIQFCGPTGSDAVEAALKLFRTATGRRSVIAFHGAYHGMTSGALALMGNLGPKAAGMGMGGETHFFPYPSHARCPFGVGGEEGEELTLRYLDNVLKDPESGITKPAMLILEAIQGEGGCIPASAHWLRRIRDITLQHDIPLVIDEVQTGFGRTGAMFAHEIGGITPDAIVMSKALGGGFPLAALAYHKRYDKWLPGTHAGTFRGNQIAMVAGAATMQFLRMRNIASQASTTGAHLRNKLAELAESVPCIGDVRGRGLMLGAEIVKFDNGLPILDGALAKQIKRACFLQGVILETGGRHGAVLRFLPALTITTQEIDTAVCRIREAMVKCLDSDAVARASATQCPDQHPTDSHGMTFKEKNYARFPVPPLSEDAMREFNTLVLDPYTGGKQRYRRFSQFKLWFGNGNWRLELLPHRPFMQAKNYNGVVGGLQRHFEPIRFDPTPQVAAGARAAALETDRQYQINVHQVRVITSSDIRGIAVPEGPHRDGHDFVMNAVFSRQNITGGVSHLMPTGGGTCFFEDVLHANEAIIFADGAMWHHATDILPCGDDRGHRDIMIVSFNAWERRRYGEDFERGLGSIKSDEGAAA